LAGGAARSRRLQSARAEVARKGVERYLDGLASEDEDTALEEWIASLGQPQRWQGRQVRALRPFTDDRARQEGIRRGEFTRRGFRHRDLPKIFLLSTTNQKEARRRSAWISQKLRLLRAHGVIRKITATHRYQLTASGRKAVTAILTALRSTVRQLTPMAA